MRIKIINPNTTGSMTERMGLYARRIAAPGTEIVAVSPDFGPPSIEGYYDEALAVPGLLAEIRPRARLKNSMATLSHVSEILDCMRRANLPVVP